MHCAIYNILLPRMGWHLIPFPPPQRVYGRTLRHNQIFSDGWFTKFSYPWCSVARFARRSSAIICNRQRQKINHPVIITAVECGDPGKPTNGKQIVKKGYVYGGSVKFVCDKNYTLVGTDVIYCQANRSWSSFVPRCLGKCHWCDRIQENKRQKSHLMFLLLLKIPRHSLIKLSENVISVI